MALTPAKYASNKRWNEANKNKKKEHQAKWMLKSKQYLKEHRKAYRVANKNKISEYKAKWKAQNVDKVRESYKRHANKRRKTLKGNLHNRITNLVAYSLKKSSKNGVSWLKLLDFTVEQLRAHLEKKFLPGMTWEKFLAGEIHIDHKIPVAAFNFETPQDIDFKKCWSLSNLRPLWAEDNRLKGAKLQNPFQPSLTI